MKNRVAATFLLTLLLVLGLGALHWLPRIELGGKPLRRVDLLADIRLEASPVSADSDTSVLPEPVKPTFIDTCKSGMTCIEDFSDSTMRGMKSFYEALINRSSLGRPVRIAYFGDSFIEADIMTGDLRTLLQQKFGGSGVGYIPVASNLSGYRPTVVHSFSGWSSHAITDSVFFDRKRQDISNHYFIPRPGASVTLRGRKQGEYADSCNISTIYFRTNDSIRLSASVNGGEARHFVLGGDSLMQSVSVTGNIKSVSWKVEQLDSAATATFYAATMDPASGIVLDNFSTRGSNGQQLMHIPSAILQQYERLRTYDLIVLQYGLNVASEQGVNYAYYQTAMEKVVNYLKREFPQASILIVGVGDRDYRTETGELRTMPGVKNLIRFQKALAAQTHVAFWNLFEAMGGEGSMAELVNRKPALANYDYTHINFRGGKYFANLLFETFVYGKEQYEKRKAYEMQ